MIWVFYGFLILMGAAGLGLTIWATVKNYRGYASHDIFDAIFNSICTFTTGICSTAICICCTCLIALLIILMCGG